MTDHAVGQRFSMGSAISRGFSIYFQNLTTFIPMSIIAYVPVWIGLAIFGSATEAEATAPMGPSFAVASIVLAVLGLISTYWLQAALVYGTIATMRGTARGMADTLSKSFGPLLSVILLAIVLGVITGLGFLLFVIPGVILAVMYIVAIPAAVVERGGVGAAMGRSLELTRGHRWSLFWMLVVLILIAILVSGILSFIVMNIGSGVAMWIDQLVNLVISGIWASIIAVTYHDLRILKEGGGTEEIARAFD